MFFCKKFRCRTYLFSSVDKGVDSMELGVGMFRLSRKRSPSGELPGTDGLPF